MKCNGYKKKMGSKIPPHHVAIWGILRPALKGTFTTDTENLTFREKKSEKGRKDFVAGDNDKDFSLTCRDRAPLLFMKKCQKCGT